MNEPGDSPLAGHAMLPRFAVEVAIESGVGERVNADNEPASLAESQTRL